MIRIGVCADVHSHASRFQLVLDDMVRAGVDERWCLGDLVGGEGDPVQVVRLARRLDLCLLGNHDALMLAGHWWPDDAGKLRGRDAVWLSLLKPLAERHGIRCWHGAPSQPLWAFLDDDTAADELRGLPPATLGLVGHTHVPTAYARDRARVFEIRPEPGRRTLLNPGWVVVANPGAVGGGADPREPWWLELDLAERSVRWHSCSELPRETGS